MNNDTLILHECQLLGKFQWYEPQCFDPKKRGLDPVKVTFVCQQMSLHVDSVEPKEKKCIGL